MSEEVKSMLRELNRQGYITTIISSGDVQRLYQQIKNVDIHLIGQYGLQIADIKNGELIIIKDDKINAFDNTTQIAMKVSEFRKRSGFCDYVGRSFIINNAGFLIISLLGDESNKELRNNFDPDQKKRKQYINLLKEIFPNTIINICGKTSYDVIDGKFCKYSALKSFCISEGCDISQALFFGDQLYNETGNDYSIYYNNVDCVNVDDYRHIIDIVKSTLAKNL